MATRDSLRGLREKLQATAGALPARLLALHASRDGTCCSSTGTATAPGMYSRPWTILAGWALSGSWRDLTAPDKGDRE
jgi:hypothetical protein